MNKKPFQITSFAIKYILYNFRFNGYQRNMLELLFFAGIAFFIISRLISTLGVTSDDDPTKQKTFFGEKGKVKDVTGNLHTNNVKEANFVEKETTASKPSDDLNDIIINDNVSNILKNIESIQESLPSFNPRNFLKSAKAAFKMIIEAGKDNKDNLKLLVDKRYIDHFKSIITSYGDIEKANAPEAKILDIYTFGNNVFIKILFTGKDITTNINDLQEEWTFSKSLIQSGPDWYLTNIDRPQ